MFDLDEEVDFGLALEVDEEATRRDEAATPSPRLMLTSFAMHDRIRTHARLPIQVELGRDFVMSLNSGDELISCALSQHDYASEEILPGLEKMTSTYCF